MQFGQIAYAIKQTIKPSAEDTAQEAEDRERAKQIRRANRNTQSSPKAVLDLDNDLQMQAVKGPHKSQGAQGAGNKQLIQDPVATETNQKQNQKSTENPSR